MTFTGQITKSTDVSGVDQKYGQPYHGVNITVVEPKTNQAVYNNKATIYIKDATSEQYPVGATVTVEPRVDIEISRSTGRLYNTVACYLVQPENY